MNNTLSYEIIQPSADFLTDSAILVQSWKKAHAYIRSHNWYADSLELDISALRLNSLVNEWSKLLTADEIQNYSPDPMRLVPAPKSHPWTLEEGWKPSNDENSELKLRPLAHLSIRDQTLSMATLICFADIVETAQGDPSLSINKNNRAKVVSYGHRLVSRWSEGKAVFKWGNAKLYRQYFEDYQQFVHRPEKIRQELFPDGGSWAIVQADLTQFYDLIPRDELLIRLKTLAKNSGVQHDRKFFEAFSKIHSWAWAENDAQLAFDVCKNNDESGLPQGLATSGFFANAYLIEFDKAIIALFDKKRSGAKWRILDYCRYVDDMRFVVDLAEQDLAAFEIEFKAFLTELLGKKAPGLQLNEKKTQVMYGNSHSPNVPVAEAMQAVNNSVSGPLDVETARHALEMLEGLLAVSNSRQSQSTPTGTGQDEILRRILSVEPDVRNDTLERFVAHRWRKVFRSLRVMADADEMTDTSLNVGRSLLDQRAKTFAVNLLRKWILDPSNVRLLRVSLDLFPSHEHLQVVLTFLETYLDTSDEHRKEALICEYISAELLRAGATETGFVRDDDELPVGVDIEKYRAMLADFAAKQLEQTGSKRSWYFQQQALLCLAVFGKHLSFERAEKGPNYSYIQLHQALGGVWPNNSKGSDDTPSRSLPIIMIAHQVSGDTETVSKTLANWIARSEPDVVQRQIGALLSEDSELLSSVIEQLPETTRDFWDERCKTIGYLPSKRAEYWKPTQTPSAPIRLLDVLSSDQNPFQQETAALRLARDLTAELAKLDRNSFTGTVTPAIITLRSNSWTKIDDPTASISSNEFSVVISPNEDVTDVRFRIPSWCSKKQQLRVEIGQLLRAAILSRPDFSGGFWPAQVIQGVRKYRGTSTSWFKRKHGLLNERHGLGDRLLPMSPWMSEFLGRLLEWPGTHARRELVKLRENCSPANILNCINQRLAELSKNYCRLSRMPLYTFPVPELGNRTVTGKLKVAVVQTALPSQKNFTEFGAELNDPSFRRKHRRHLAAMLRLLLKTLSVRKGYCDPDEHIDVVLLPELSVHADDVYILTRFADSAKCMVFCGLVFHPPARKPNKLINSGLWILPVRTSEGRSIRFVEQGKQNLTPGEVEMGITPYRPCQWVIEARSNTNKPWRLSAAICYDATDLSLAADLRNSSDAFIVSALNRDIGTFDAMVTALHYHMFQHVVLVNSAEFGGSTAQAPYVENYEKVIVHHHGMNQPIVSVIELDLAKFRGKPSKTKKKGKEAGQIKYPPAGVER
jgi:hypothetical protein